MQQQISEAAKDYWAEVRAMQDAERNGQSWSEIHRGAGVPGCGTCGGLGYFSYDDLPLNHPQFGKLQTCGCRADTDAFVRALIARSGLRDNEMQRGLSDLVDWDGYTDALTSARELLDRGTGWLTVIGQPATYGEGKTALGLATATERLRARLEVQYVVVPLYLDTLRASFEDREKNLLDIRGEFAASPFFIGDETEVVAGSEWVQEQLHVLFNERYRRAHEAATMWLFSGDGYAKLQKFHPAAYSRTTEFERVWIDAGDVRPTVGAA